MPNKVDEQAFPTSFDAFNLDGTTNHYCRPGITIGMYAAIHLCVPASGDPDIDAMIRQSRREKFAKAAMQAMIANRDFSVAVTLLAKEKDCKATAMIADTATGAADALIAHLDAASEGKQQ